MGRWSVSRSVGVVLLIVIPACLRASRPLVSVSAMLGGGVEDLPSVRVNGVELHYVERGKGNPIVFVHGALADYREWAPVMDELSSSFRTVAYSRRYNYPNQNPLEGDSYSSRVDAQDLNEMIRQRKLGPTHVVGVSYGALTALWLAIAHPESVRTLTLVEPPLIRWLPELPGGKAEFDRFQTQLIAPAAAAFRAGEQKQALRVAMDFLRIPQEAVETLQLNLREWEAITTSADGFPWVPPGAVRRLAMPVLMISGDRTYAFIKITDAELERLLPRVHHVIVKNATHQVCSEQPPVCAAAIRAHLAGN